MKEINSIVYLLAKQKVRSMNNRAKYKLTHPNYHEANGEVRAYSLAITLLKQVQYGR